MSAYIHKLQEDIEEQKSSIFAENDPKSIAARQRLTPLEDRLARLLDTIPTDVRLDGLSLSALQTSLKGRWRGRCHPGELGAALRKLGYQRRRQWRDNEGFRSLWFPE